VLRQFLWAAVEDYPALVQDTDVVGDCECDRELLHDDQDAQLARRPQLANDVEYYVDEQRREAFGRLHDQIVLPYAKQGLLGDVYDNARVLSEDYDTIGRIMKVRGLPGAIARLRRALAAS
jgi:hypothetical protein